LFTGTIQFHSRDDKGDLLIFQLASTHHPKILDKSCMSNAAKNQNNFFLKLQMHPDKHFVPIKLDSFIFRSLEVN